MARTFTNRKSGFITRSGVARRESLWLSIDPTSSTIAANGVVLIAVLNAAALALRPFTVVRTRGVFNTVTDQNAASEVYHGSLAMAVVSEQAAAIGVTAVPTPGTDRDSDLFFLYEEQMGEFTLGDATGFIEEHLTKEFDSKAMRKVNNDQQVAIVAESETGGNGIIMRVAGRMLIKLH